MPRAATELTGADRALVRMSGLGSNTTASTEPTELRLTETPTAMARLRERQPASAAPAPGESGLDLREMLAACSNCCDERRRCPAGPHRAGRSRAALQALYKLQSVRLFGVAMAILRDRDAASDAVHDGFVNIARRAAQFDPERARPRPWLGSVIRHAALDIARSRGREIPTTFIECITSVVSQK